MIRTVTDEIRNETFYYDTRRRRWVDPDEIPRHKRSCTGFCEGCSPKLGGCEDDNFELEDEADAGEVVPVP
jgi:hypothetical protein